MRLLSGVLSAFWLSAAVSVDDHAWTRKHEAGRCALRGHCGAQSFFGSDLPCPYNGPAEEPDDRLRQKLVDVCGEKWSQGPICCMDDQVSYACSSPSYRSKG